MVFSSSLFVFLFLPLFLIIYHLVGAKLKNYTILLFSIIFYSWGAPKLIIILLASLSINFYLVKLMHKKDKGQSLYLILSLLINISLLVYFKYTNFFIENVNDILLNFGMQQISWTRIALPIGISFFTFQSITYTIDVKRGTHAPLEKLSDYILYILMFPQLIAGPIVQFHTIADQITDRRKHETYNNKITGFYRFILGLAKKVLIANILGEQVDSIFDGNIANINSAEAWFGMIAYSFQIYFDFSGYSDMAIGLGRITGFKFPENFNNPYISQNITEFWRRWHITLGKWMRDYLYIPLGGNRVNSKARLYFNLITVFLISGFWHGASWNFVIWGAFHGLFLILDRIFLIRLLKPLGTLPRVIITYFIVLLGWVFFRIENLSDALLILNKMFEFKTFSLPEFGTEFYITSIIAFVFSFVVLLPFGKKAEHYFYTEDYTNKQIFRLLPLYLILFIISMAYITSTDFNPFIYFRF